MRKKRGSKEGKNYPFFGTHMGHMRKKCGSNEGTSLRYPREGKIGEAEVDFHDYHVPKSQVAGWGASLEVFGGMRGVPFVEDCPGLAGGIGGRDSLG
jgi:hypothetical protein